MSDKIGKLLRLAIDARTPQPEAATAFEMLRRLKPSWDDLKNAITAHAVNEYESARLKQFAPEHRAMLRIEASARFKDIRLWFGKHNGLRLSQVGRDDYPYLVWLSENMNRMPDAFMLAVEQAMLIYDPELAGYAL